MNDQGAFAASLLDASRKAYAAGIVLRLRETGQPADHFRGLGFAQLTADTQVRLQHLAEALACGRPELFALDVSWLAATYAARCLPLEALRAMLESMRHELEEGLPQSSASLATRFIAVGLESLNAPPESTDSPLAQARPHAELSRVFLLALLERDRERAQQIVFDALAQGVRIQDLHHHVITPAQTEIGRMWQTGEVHVAEEHLGSRIVEDVLAQLRTRMQRGSSTHRVVLLASVSGNLHDIGLRIVADQFEMNGWRSLFLGANMPIADLAQAASEIRPDLIALSVGLPINLRSAAETIAALRSALPETKILVGGRPFAMISELWRDVGADGCAGSAEEAVRVGGELAEAR